MTDTKVRALRLLSLSVYAVACVSLTAISACGGGGGATPSPPPPPTSPPPPAPAPTIATTSYANYKAIGLTPQTLPTGDNTIRAYGNFSGNGRLDLFRAVLTYSVNLPISQATPSRFEFYDRQADGSFVPNATLLPQGAGCLHPRKAVVADFNGDGRPDIFVACHGYDAAPFPGERNRIILSQPGGLYAVSDASSDIGFHHAATAADLNGDGRPDVVVVNNFDPMRAYVLVNDGMGHFTREGSSRLPLSLQGGNYFSVELVDVNEDGRLDLIIGGHEWQGAPTSVFLNPASNDFTSVTGTTLPPVANEGVVLDFTVTGTGTSRAIWVLRTSGGDGTFYQSRVVQRVSFPTLNSTVVINQRPMQWIPWLVPAVVGNAAVITSDNASDGISVPQ
jgi:hypothetical protein